MKKGLQHPIEIDFCFGGEGGLKKLQKELPHCKCGTLAVFVAVPPQGKCGVIKSVVCGVWCCKAGNSYFNSDHYYITKSIGEKTEKGESDLGKTLDPFVSSLCCSCSRVESKSKFFFSAVFLSRKAFGLCTGSSSRSSSRSSRALGEPPAFSIIGRGATKTAFVHHTLYLEASGTGPEAF